MTMQQVVVTENPQLIQHERLDKHDFCDSAALNLSWSFRKFDSGTWELYIVSFSSSAVAIVLGWSDSSSLPVGMLSDHLGLGSSSTRDTMLHGLQEEDGPGQLMSKSAVTGQH